jgi:hypothetical protein
MNKRPPIIAVRPRKGSDLERAQTEHENNMADLLHSWAEQFARLAKESDNEQ